MNRLKNYQPSYSESSLMALTKVELIEHIRILEHNINVQEEQIENQKKYMEELQRKICILASGK